MGRARPGGRFRDKSPLEEFVDLGGNARFLEELLRHPALKVIERLDKDEGERFRMAQRLTEVNDTLSKAAASIGEVAAWISVTDSVRSSVPRWLEDIRVSSQSLNRIKLGLEVERYRHDGVRRKGLFILHPERYFFTACLAPYTAFLNHARGKKPNPDWEWIERWIRNTSDQQEEKDLHLRGWWAKEVLRRKSWAPRTLLYALAAGAAVPLEDRRGGKRAEWIIDWIRLNIPGRAEAHPIQVKRRLSAEDSVYLECVSKYVPPIRKSFLRVYPRAKALAVNQPADPLEALFQKKAAAGIDALPTRMRLRLAQMQGESLNTRAMVKEHLAKSALQDSPVYRSWLKRLSKQKRRPA